MWCTGLTGNDDLVAKKARQADGTDGYCMSNKHVCKAEWLCASKAYKEVRKSREMSVTFMESGPQQGSTEHEEVPGTFATANMLYLCVSNSNPENLSEGSR